MPLQQQRVVGAPVAGLLEQVDVLLGQSVRAGQVLALMRSPALVELQRGLVEAEVRAQLADETERRDRALLDEGLIPEARWRSARAQTLAAPGGPGRTAPSAGDHRRARWRRRGKTGSMECCA